MRSRWEAMSYHRGGLGHQGILLSREEEGGGLSCPATDREDFGEARGRGPGKIERKKKKMVGKRGNG